MNKKAQKRGSIIFVIMLLLMGLACIMYSALRNASYMISVIREREKSEQCYYYAYSLKQFISAHYSDYIHTATATHKTLFRGAWPHKTSHYQGQAWFEQHKGVKTVYVQLEKNKKLLVSLFWVV